MNMNQTSNVNILSCPHIYLDQTKTDSDTDYLTKDINSLDAQFYIIKQMYCGTTQWYTGIHNTAPSGSKPITPIFFIILFLQLCFPHIVQDKEEESPNVTVMYFDIRQKILNHFFL